MTAIGPMQSTRFAKEKQTSEVAGGAVTAVDLMQSMRFAGEKQTSEVAGVAVTVVGPMRSMRFARKNTRLRLQGEGRDNCWAKAKYNRFAMEKTDV